MFGLCHYTAFLLRSRYKREIVIDANQKMRAKMFVADVLIKGKTLEIPAIKRINNGLFKQ